MAPTRVPQMHSSGRLGGVTRHPGIAMAAVAMTGVLAAVQYRRSALTRNERAQKNSPDHPNFYVSVDRSGGGI
ncbi:hypothetical protein GGR52DRAFT_337860 [Hypoxylon sp. FL1284]|nr:hypothetical protein GGR52DRAFT_337860 [Hypoxylon sp. FL1284]